MSLRHRVQFEDVLPILSEVAILGSLLHGGQILSNLSNCGNVKWCIFLLGDLGRGGAEKCQFWARPDMQVATLDPWAYERQGRLKILAIFVDFFVEFEDVLLIL